MQCLGKCGREVEEGLYCDQCMPDEPGTLYLRQFIFERSGKQKQDTEDTEVTDQKIEKEKP